MNLTPQQLAYLVSIDLLTSGIATLGGAMVAMFGIVVATGIKILSTVDFNRQELHQ
ncbi:MAG: hypothetical protein WD907_03025 [Bacilli bacterium]